MINRPYIKAVGLSLAVHAVLLGNWLGGCGSDIAKPLLPMSVEFYAANAAEDGTSSAVKQAEPVAGEKKGDGFGQQGRPVQSISAQEATGQYNPEKAVDGRTGVPALSAGDSIAAGKEENAGGTVQATTVGTSGEASALHSQARYISGLRPLYPQEACRARQEGSVAIRLLVGTDGWVKEASLMAGSAYTVLDEAALRAVKKWRFSPASNGKNAVESYCDVRVRFQLED